MYKIITAIWIFLFAFGTYAAGFGENSRETAPTQTISPISDTVNKAQFNAAVKQGITFNHNGTVLIKCPRSITGTVVIPEGVVSIISQAFNWCEKLEKVVIPPSVKYIGTSSFAHCKSLKKVTIPAAEEIAGTAFAWCDNLEEVILPENLKSIERSAFAYNRKLKKITIPAGVTRFGDTVFTGAAGVQIAPDHPFLLQDKHGALFDTSQNAILYLPTGFTGHYRIPDGITAIRAEAFYQCKNLTGITIPAGVTVIEMSAFSGCSSLKEVVIPDGVKLLGISAFNYCPELQSVTIPDSVKNIGHIAFIRSHKLKQVSISRDCNVGYKVFPPECKVIRR